MGTAQERSSRFRRREDRRADDLIRAAWTVIDDLPLESSMGAFTTKAVAARAGVTTGSFFHHFPNVAAFTDAMALGLDHDEVRQVEELPELLAALEARDVIELLREAMVARWERHRLEPERLIGLRHEMLAWASHHRPLAEPTADAATVGDVLRRRMRSRQDEVAQVWDFVLKSVGRTVVDPFTLDRLSTALTALFYGLGIRHAIEPEAVDDELFADLVGVLVAALSKPMGSDRQLSDLSARLEHSWPDPAATPQARTGARRRADTRHRIVDLATGMFGDGWEAITASEVAERAGVSNQTVANLFSGVRAVAACTFRVHMPACSAAANSATSAQERLDAVLTELADRAQGDPEPARALLAERIATIARRGELLGDGDVRSEVPLTDPLIGPLQSLLPHHNAASVASTLVHFTLTEAVTGSGAPAEIAARAVHLSTAPELAAGPLGSDEATSDG